MRKYSAKELYLWNMCVIEILYILFRDDARNIITECGHCEYKKTKLFWLGSS